ncbi:hypothetical protein LAV33_06605 [Bacillus safensis]|uniref:hypothetical protein n=1 Tax=Bacillus safensis TaxID=561879 RepID=UPI002B24A6D2|nr:hypothetical protein [Bacillus safensis]MEB2269933.1 hypothetical protein [Bacillus safensis]
MKNLFISDKQIPYFDVNPLEQINEFHHFKGYNESYDLINCIALLIPYESNESC